VKFSRGAPTHFAGTADATKSYDAGAIVVHRGQAYVARRDHVCMPPNVYAPADRDWASLGSFGASPTQVSHKWHPKDAQYPIGDAGELSEPAIVCADCWQDADYRNAFRPEVHLYVIRELGL